MKAAQFVFELESGELAPQIQHLTLEFVLRGVEIGLLLFRVSLFDEPRRV